MSRVVATGTWVHDGAVTMPVQIVESERESWFEVAKADGDLEPGERAHLNEHGLCYYVVFTPARGRDSFQPGSMPFLSLEDAQASAASRVPGEIDWHV